MRLILIILLHALARAFVKNISFMDAFGDPARPDHELPAFEMVDLEHVFLPFSDFGSYAYASKSSTAW